MIAVEHEREVILAADHIIDMGPGAGRLGGEIVAEGSVKEIIESERSLTGKYLVYPLNPHPHATRKMSSGLHIKNAFIHNLKHSTLKFLQAGSFALPGFRAAGNPAWCLTWSTPPGKRAGHRAAAGSADLRISAG